MNKYQETGRFLDDTAASSCAALVFGFYTLLLLAMMLPTGSNWVYADPVLKIFPAGVTLWGIPILSILLFIAWQMWRPTRGEAVRPAAIHAFSGVATALLALLALRLAIGDQLPAFVPPEESVKPGALLGMSAGLVEELVMRLMLTPLLFVVFRNWMGFHGAALGTIVVAAIGFAIWHEIGLPAEAFDPAHVMTRIMVPGVVMGLATFYISPIFIVTLHCTVHVVQPWLFV